MSRIPFDRAYESIELNSDITSLYAIEIVDNSGPKVEVPRSVLAKVDNQGTAVTINSVVTVGLSFTDIPGTSKIVLMWIEDVTNYVYAAVGEVSGDTITLGASLQLSTDGALRTACCYDTTNDKVLLMWVENPSDNYSAIGTVSGNTITAGTPTLISATAYTKHNVVHDISNDKFFFAYGAGTNINCRIGTATGTTITWSNFSTALAVTSSDFDVLYDPDSTKIIVASVTDSASTEKIVLGQISGTSITFGTPQDITTDNGDDGVELAYDTVNNKVLLVYQNGSSSVLDTMVGTVSGTTITFGTTTTISTGATIEELSLSYILTEESFVVIYGWSGSSFYGRIGKISGTTITWSDSTVIDTSSTSYWQVKWIEDANRMVLYYLDSSDYLNVKTAAPGTFYAAEYTNTIGVAVESGTTGQSKKVALFGDILSGFTGQTPGAIGYLQYNGSISETSSSYPIGRFISATELLITKTP